MRRAALAASFAADKKAQDIVVLDVQGLCNFADVFVLCTGTNRVQLNAISDGIQRGFKQLRMKNPVDEGRRNGNWAVLDYGDVVVHIMSEEARSFYRLERLWGDAVEVDWESHLAEADAEAVSARRS